MRALPRGSASVHGAQDARKIEEMKVAFDLSDAQAEKLRLEADQAGGLPRTKATFQCRQLSAGDIWDQADSERQHLQDRDEHYETSCRGRGRGRLPASTRQKSHDARDADDDR